MRLFNFKYRAVVCRDYASVALRLDARDLIAVYVDHSIGLIGSQSNVAHSKSESAEWKYFENLL